MPPIQIIADYAASTIPHLEPLSGISLVINLAYLNLKRSRYKEQITAIASKALLELEGKKDGGSAISKLDQFTGLKVLADVEAISPRLPFFIRVFHRLYGNPWDIRLCSFFSVFAGLILCVGVAHKIELGAWLLSASGRGPSIVYFWILVVSLLTPAVLVLTGRTLVAKSKVYARDCEKQLASVYEDKIDEVEAAPVDRVADI